MILPSSGETSYVQFMSKHHPHRLTFGSSILLGITTPGESLAYIDYSGPLSFSALKSLGESQHLRHPYRVMKVLLSPPRCGRGDQFGALDEACFLQESKDD